MERWDLMRNIDTKMDFSSISILTLLVLFLSPMLLAFGNIGTICVFVCILSLLLFSLVIKKDFLDKATQKQYNKIILSFYMYIMWLFIAMIWGGIDFVSIIRIVQFVGCASAFSLAAKYPFRPSHFKAVYLLIELELMVCVLFWLYSKCPVFNYAFFYTNPNVFAMILLSWIVIFSLKREKKLMDKIALILCIFFLIFTTARATIVSMGVFVFYNYFVDKSKMDINKTIISILMYFEVLIIIFMILMYTNLPNTELGNQLQVFSVTHFHKNFFSGRHMVWKSLLQYIKAKPYIGYGLATVPSSLIGNIKYSSHNIYIQTAIQMGLIGVFFLIMIFNSIICMCANNHSNSMRSIVLTFMFILIFHECFEITLTQNLVSIGLVSWFIMGIGCNFRINQNW